ncbi:MAG: cupin [Aeromicrobium sp.]|nr:cupin [Aeromicrobium sp.]
MTISTSTPASIFRDADAVVAGPLPIEISMEPIISGAPFAYEDVLLDGPDGFFAVWACDAGVYPRVKDRRGSFMYLLSGAGTITDQDGTVHELTADSILLLPYGWIGHWDIRETIRKVYLHTWPVSPFREGVQPSVFVSTDELAERELVVFDGPDGLCVVREIAPGVAPDQADDEAVFLYVISGEATVTDQNGTAHELSAGSALAMPTGWSGSWDVRTTLRVLDIRSTPTPRTEGH